MPYKLTRTSPASFPSSRSVLFNGTNRYLRVANNAVLIPGLLDFTIEGWVNLTSYSDYNFKVLGYLLQDSSNHNVIKFYFSNEK